MKKLMYCVMFAFSFLLIGVCVSTFTINEIAHAALPDNISAQSISSGLYYNTIGDALISENNVYSLAFNNNFAEDETIDTTNNPYGTYYLGIDIETYPRNYADLDYSEKQQIYRDVLSNITINGTLISFNDNEVTNQGNYILYADDDNAEYFDTYDRMYIRIVPIKAGSTNISCSIYNLNTQISIDCAYANPTSLTLEYDQSLLNQLYENFQPVTINTSLNFQDWLNSDTSYTYEWMLGSQLLTNTTSSLTVDKSMIKIGNYLVTVTIEGTLLQASVRLVITTEQDYDVTVTVDQNLLEQNYTDVPVPIEFDASIAVQESYEVSWYLKSPNSLIYSLQPTTSSRYTFITTEHGIGEFKVFAVVSYENTNYFSQLYTIKINPREVQQGQVFNITYTEYVSENTGLTAYRCSVDAEEYYESEDVIWSVNGIQYANGLTFNFEPTQAQEYIISVRMRNTNGTYTTAPAVPLTARVVQQVEMWVYILIAAVVIVIICIASILISNKAREKIW